MAAEEEKKKVWKLDGFSATEEAAFWRTDAWGMRAREKAYWLKQVYHADLVPYIENWPPHVYTAWFKTHDRGPNNFENWMWASFFREQGVHPFVTKKLVYARFGDVWKHHQTGFREFESIVDNQWNTVRAYKYPGMPRVFSSSSYE